ncbi:MAG: TetR/AcrR family transcriptional regulator [Acidimicrobiales bacterium]
MTTGVRPLRADAARNREKILAAAAVLFAERGLDASLDDVAHEAGVGVGTLYRRFRDKEALVEALFENAVEEIVNLAIRASATENSWDGLVWFLEQVLQRQCANRGLRDVVVGSSYGQVRIAEAKRRIVPSISTLIERAQRDGYLRRDVVDADFPILESMISSIGAMTSASSPELWRRYLTIILDGLATERTGPSRLGAGPPSEAAHEAILRAKRYAAPPRSRDD